MIKLKLFELLDLLALITFQDVSCVQCHLADSIIIEDLFLYGSKKAKNQKNNHVTSLIIFASILQYVFLTTFFLQHSPFNVDSSKIFKNLT